MSGVDGGDFSNLFKFDEIFDEVKQRIEDTYKNTTDNINRKIN